MYNGDEEVLDYSRLSFLLYADRPASPTHSRLHGVHETLDGCSVDGSTSPQFDQEEDAESWNGCSDMELKMEIDPPASSDHQHNEARKKEEKSNTEGSAPTSSRTE